MVRRGKAHSMDQGIGHGADQWIFHARDGVAVGVHASNLRARGVPDPASAGARAQQKQQGDPQERDAVSACGAS